MELAKRDDVPVELTWDLSLIYPTEEAMLADAQKMKELSLSTEASYKGNLTDAATINLKRKALFPHRFFAAFQIGRAHV